MKNLFGSIKGWSSVGALCAIGLLVGMPAGAAGSAPKGAAQA